MSLPSDNANHRVSCLASLSSVGPKPSCQAVVMQVTVNSSRYCLSWVCAIACASDDSKYLTKAWQEKVRFDCVHHHLCSDERCQIV
jgi:hypothetical protein